MFCNSLVAGISLFSHNKDFKIKPLQCVWYCCVSGDASLQQLPVAQYEGGAAGPRPEGADNHGVPGGHLRQDSHPRPEGQDHKL